MENIEPVAAHENNADDLILESIDDTARLLGVSRRTVYELITRGDLRTVHVGRRHLVPRGERLQFVAKQLDRQLQAATT